MRLQDLTTPIERIEPEHWRFGGGPSETVLHPLVLIAMLIAIIVILGMSKRAALVALLLSTFLIPLGQQFVIGSVHLFVSRIIIAAGWIRMLSDRRGPGLISLGGGWNTLDKYFLLYVICRAVAFSLLNASGAAIVNQVGFVWDFLGGYILLRYLIQSEEDILRTIKWFAYIVGILAICMVGEQLTGKNVFGILGGVRLVSEVRAGRIRSEGVFQHAILAGVFGATLMPLFFWLWKSGKARVLAIFGVAGSAVMAITTACSTPIGTLAVACMGICFWPVRKYMRPLRWALGIVLIVLHLVMKAPVWALIERIDIVQGSSSFHRYQLVDEFIRHWSDWWLIGTNSNASWGNLLFDVSNQYVAEGTAGGLIVLILFICQISWCFGRLGSARKAVEPQDRLEAWLPWLLGVSLMAHVTAFLGISYFDQTRVSWFALLAMISVATARELLPPTKDVIDGPERAVSFAEVPADVYYWGEPALQPVKER
jgi:hypothetical protein